VRRIFVLRMAKSALVFVLFTLFCLSVYAALPAATVWEVRTAGSDNNGGGFVTGSSGTDRSQSNTAFCTATDLVLVTTTTATSATCPFSAASVGNLIHITAGTGFTPGFYNVQSVTVVTATLDRAAGTMGSTGGTFALGGAVQSPVTAAAAVTAGNTIWLKNDGTYTVTTSITPANGGNNLTLATSMQGYTTTRGDSGKAVITTATNSVNLITTQNNMYYKNLSLSNTATVRAFGFTRAGITGFVADHIDLDGFSSAFRFNGTVSGLSLFYVEVKNSTGAGFLVDSTNGGYGNLIAYSYFHGNGAAGINHQGNILQIVYVGDVFASNAAEGMIYPNIGAGGTSPLDAQITVVNSVFYSNTDGIKVSTTARYEELSVVNSVFYGNSGVGITMGLGPGFAFAYNNAFNGTPTNNYPTSVGQVTLTADPFTNAATGDYSLNSTAGGGAVIKANGFPGVSLFGTGYLDIGALQSMGSSSGGAHYYGITQ
jgi:hypothetical protein